MLIAVELVSCHSSYFDLGKVQSWEVRSVCRRVTLTYFVVGIEENEVARNGVRYDLGLGVGSRWR